jgi:hypothetical protein
MERALKRRNALHDLDCHDSICSIKRAGLPLVVRVRLLKPKKRGMFEQNLALDLRFRVTVGLQTLRRQSRDL